MNDDAAIAVGDILLRPNEPAPTYLLQAERDGKIKPAGTAFPTFINGYIALITAAHNVVNGDVKAIIGSRGMATIAGSIVYLNRKLDVAAIIADSRDIVKASGNILYVVPGDKGKEHDAGLELFQLTGWPQSKKNTFTPYKKQFDRFSYVVSLGGAFEGTLRESGIPAEHACIRYLNEHDLVNDDGTPSNALKTFYGFSGGPVIRISVVNEKPNAGVAGVFLEWHKQEKACVFVKWSAVTEWLESILT